MLICDKCRKELRGVGYNVKIAYTIRYLCKDRKKIAYKRICWKCKTELDELLNAQTRDFFKDVNME